MLWREHLVLSAALIHNSGIVSKSLENYSVQILGEKRHISLKKLYLTWSFINNFCLRVGNYSSTLKGFSKATNSLPFLNHGLWVNTLLFILMDYRDFKNYLSKRHYLLFWIAFRTMIWNISKKINVFLK